MKSAIYSGIGHSGKFTLSAIAFIYNFIAESIVGLGRITYNAHQAAIISILRVIDNKKTDQFEQASKQSDMLLEFDLLQKVIQIKEAYLKDRVWHDGYGFVLNVVATRLINECDWSKEQVTSYIQRTIGVIEELEVEGVDEDDQPDALLP